MESVPYNVVEKVLRIVFSNTEPYPPHRTMWAKRNPENTFNFYVYNDGEWHDVSGTITIPEISVFLSAFENDAGFLTGDDITGLQEALVPGENIKTINGQSIVGSGNLVINGGGTGLDSAYEEITISDPISKNNSGYYTLPSTIYETALTAWQTGRIPVLNADLSSDTTMFSSPLVYINSNFVGYFHKSGANKTHFVCTIGSTSATINVDYEQDKLESGVNIKTINNQSLLGSGNITIQADSSAYDVTANNSGATFASLSALLSNANLSTLIPTDVRKGGMQIRFVLTPDNKYVQYRYMLPYAGNTTAENNKFVNAKNWQGVDNEPIAWSANLLESGGVKINYPLFSGVLYDYYLNSSTWSHVVGSISLYVNVKKGDVVKLNKNSDRNVYAAFIQSVDTSSAPVFKNGTSTAISVSAERTIDVVEDCILIVVAIYPGNPVQNFLPGIFEINGIGLYDQSSVIHHYNNDVIIHPTYKISGGYFNYDGSWTTSSPNTNCIVLSLLPGDTVHIKAGHNYGSRIAFVSGTVEVGTQLTFANDTNSAIGITSDEEKDFDIIEPCSIIWIGILYINASNIQDWNPVLVQINGKNYEDSTINLQVEKNTSEIYELLQDVSEIEQDVSEIGIEASNGTEALNISVNSNIAKYYQKGDSPKSFSSSKKICIITAGQSNAEGRVPYVDMPTAIKEAQPISNCLYVSKSETGAFSPINITGEWAFDLVTYYNIALQQELYVIKWATGGTSIDALGASQYHWTADYEKLNSLSFSLLWKFENEIRNHVESDGNNFDIRAMLWHQGEGDRGSLGTGANERYYVNLRNMIAYIRGVVGNERLPFITGTVSHNSDEYDEVVEAAQYKIASEDPYYRLIDMSGASLINENNHYYHFDAESSIYFGQMCFDALIDFGVITGTKINPVAPWL